MKVFFVASSAFHTEYPTAYKKIIQCIKDITGKDPYFYDEGVNPEEVQRTQDFSKFAESIKDTEKKLSESEVVIADLSIHSIGVGYDVANALNLKKPVLGLIHESIKHKVGPHSLVSAAPKNVKVEEYNDQSIENIIGSFLKEAERKLDTKFILIISPEIDRYLEWASVQKRMHKAQIVRNAVEHVMRNDSEWKEVKS